MNIAVLTPDRELFRGSISSVKVPGVKGEFQILNNHAPIVSSLLSGKVVMVTDAGEYTYWDAAAGETVKGTEPGRLVSYQIEGGFVEVLNNEVSLLVQGVTQ
ncbi:MAG: F0F1 ATP synthase subunit epsilon [Bacteroidetes bacterium]|nr:MAG: F0F1 ATP synthase subunit epsilon [Bacteroidota bacterium]